MIKFLKKKNIYLLISLFSILILISAVYVEYIIGAKPCVLCKYQRLPYIASIFICYFGYNNLKYNIWMYFLIITFVISFIISGYHVGIENNIFPEFSGCSLDNSDILDKDQLLQSLKEIPPNCKDVTFRILGFSLATINVLISLIIVIILTFKLYEKKNG